MQSSDDDIAMIQGEAAKVLAGIDTVATSRRLLDERGEFDRALWSAIAGLGWLGIGVPQSLGGLGMDLAASCVIAEEIGKALAAIPFTVTNCCMSAIARSGVADQETLLKLGAAGERIFTVALFEEGNALIPVRPRVTCANGVVTGEKLAVCAGAFADYALVLCAGGVLALVDLAQPEVERFVVDSVDNGRGYACLKFSAAPAAILGNVELLDSLLDELAVVSAFEQVGGAEKCLAETRDYALQRRAFGQPIGAFQAIKHGLADFYVLIQIARGAALSALHATREEFRLAAACARLASIRAYDHCAQEAIQFHGGIGTTWEAAQHLHLRRSRCLAEEWGASSFWQDRLLLEALGPGAAE